MDNIRIIIAGKLFFLVVIRGDCEAGPFLLDVGGN